MTSSRGAGDAAMFAAICAISGPCRWSRDAFSVGSGISVHSTAAAATLSSPKLFRIVSVQRLDQASQGGRRSVDSETAAESGVQVPIGKRFLQRREAGLAGAMPGSHIFNLPRV